ncbi:5-formyltetrahydrofolate cyclo-ligase [Zafaria sp. J156]|uniref:5-formyltetrahydrofolate cyclo-ligase n=1 Tax=Zafaria sp. J156 TaxID=3116490 RepID=UPI002E79AB7B|nr:5-formyltetrahydrofolate cyclo-ligase [Zafaria sp. J156]MEE1620452.1 5-formyltetrahydrofolate cyclo-ligase [Zafaria sp. J156]
MLTKDDARTLYRARRRVLGAPARDAEAARIAAHLLPWLEEAAPRRRVASVLSYGAEPPTGPLNAELHARGFAVVVPVCEPERLLSWVRWHPGVPMGRSAVAPIDEPIGTREDVRSMARTDVVLVPAQLVDSSGARMGQGGGYYDRFIASLDALPARPVLLASVYRHELLPAGSFEVDALDRRVDGVVTADGFTWFAPPLPPDGPLA